MLSIRAASECETSLLSNYPNAGAYRFCARGASPSMRERRINLVHHALCTGELQALASTLQRLWCTLSGIQQSKTNLDIRICSSLSRRRPELR